jgi:hypothetical protein
VPAAAVIPAPIVYIKVVAVKTLVVGFSDWGKIGNVQKIVERRFFGNIVSIFLDSIPIIGGDRSQIYSTLPALPVRKLECLKQIQLLREYV